MLTSSCDLKTAQMVPSCTVHRLSGAGNRYCIRLDLIYRRGSRAEGYVHLARKAHPPESAPAGRAVQETVLPVSAAFDNNAIVYLRVRLWTE